MATEPKSPQEKKRLAYEKEHFSPGEHSESRHTWKRKKAFTNREYRRKSAQLFANVKPGMGAEETSLITEDVTVSHLKEAVTKKRLRKYGVMTLAEKVPLKLEQREKRADRRVIRRAGNRDTVVQAINILSSLEGDHLIEFVRRFAVLYRGGDPVGYQQMRKSKDPLDQAFYFVYEMQCGRGVHRDIVCADEELKTSLSDWETKANRILTRDRRALERKHVEKRKTEAKINMLRRDRSAES